MKTGSVANVTAALGGNETINLNVAIQVGTLNIGASSGTSTFTIAPGTAGALTLAVSRSLGSLQANTAIGSDEPPVPLRCLAASAATQSRQTTARPATARPR